MALYNVKRTFVDYDDLQKMISVSEDLQSKTYIFEQVEAVKMFLLNNNMLNDSNIQKVKVEDALVKHLNDLHNYLAAFSVDAIDDEYFNVLMYRIIESNGAFIKNKDIESDYEINVDETVKVDEFKNELRELFRTFSLSSLLKFVYKYKLNEVSYKSATGNETKYNDVLVLRPVLETLSSDYFVKLFTDTRLADFYFHFAGIGTNSGIDEDFVDEINALNNDYFEMGNDLIMKFKHAKEIIYKNFDKSVYEKMLMHNLDRLFDEDFLKAAPEIYKLFNKENIKFNNVRECLYDYIRYTNGGACKFKNINDKKVQNEITSKINDYLGSKMKTLMNGIIDVAVKMDDFTNNVKKVRIKNAEDRLLENVLMMWQDYLKELAKRSVMYDDLKKDMRSIVIDAADNVNLTLFKKDFDCVELIRKTDMAFKEHFFDDIAEFVSETITNKQLISLTDKINVEIEVVKLLQAVFETKYDKNSKYKAYRDSALIVYKII